LKINVVLLIYHTRAIGIFPYLRQLPALISRLIQAELEALAIMARFG
jgi:hypothetical protein